MFEIIKKVQDLVATIFIIGVGLIVIVWLISLSKTPQPQTSTDPTMASEIEPGT